MVSMYIHIFILIKDPDSSNDYITLYYVYYYIIMMLLHNDIIACAHAYHYDYVTTSRYAKTENYELPIRCQIFAVFRSRTSSFYICCVTTPPRMLAYTLVYNCASLLHAYKYKNVCNLLDHCYILIKYIAMIYNIYNCV